MNHDRCVASIAGSITNQCPEKEPTLPLFLKRNETGLGRLNKALIKKK